MDLAIAYLLRDSAAAASQFLRELEDALAGIAQRPAIGSPKYARLLKGLRFWRLRRFRYLVFYLQRPSYVDIIRVLHEARDIPAALRSKRNKDDE